MKRSIWAPAGAAALAGAMALAAGPAQAEEARAILERNLYGGTIDAGIAALKPLAEAGDSQARFGLGALQFWSGVEHLMQAFYRHGVAQPESDMGLGFDFAIPLPVPVNPHPEPLDYDGVRAVLQTFVDDMDAAKATLVEAGQGDGFVALIDPMRIRIDIDGDGVGSDYESMASVARQMGLIGDPSLDIRATEVPEDAPMADDAPEASKAVPPDTSVGFDNADAFWLAGYSQILAVQADFVLAHDFSDLAAATFHRVFPKAGFPMQGMTARGTLAVDPVTDAVIADLIAAIHTMDWPVIDPDRLKGVRDRLKTILALSREDWAAILAETDDRREFIPNPKQTPIMPDMAISQEMADAWLETLDTLDLILDGKLLIPHWRFAKGFDLKAYFDTATRTDLVLILTGYGALPFLKDGPVASMESFRAANRVFGDSFFGFAIYFN